MTLPKWLSWGRKKCPPSIEQVKNGLINSCREFYPCMLVMTDGRWNVSAGDPKKIAAIIVENAVERETVDVIVKEYRDKLTHISIQADIKTRKAQAIINRMTEE